MLNNIACFNISTSFMRFFSDTSSHFCSQYLIFSREPYASQQFHNSPMNIATFLLEWSINFFSGPKFVPYSKYFFLPHHSVFRSLKLILKINPYYVIALLSYIVCGLYCFQVWVFLRCWLASHENPNTKIS